MAPAAPSALPPTQGGAAVTFVEALVAAQPGWAWLALVAALLALETATGSGYLLWPAASAGVVAVLAFVGVPLGVPGEVLLFAMLTVVSTIAARRFWPRRPRVCDPPDLNDMRLRLIGHEGRAVAAGRVFVDGKEWAAEWDPHGPAPPGAPVRVLAVVGGARLRVCGHRACRGFGRLAGGAGPPQHVVAAVGVARGHEQQGPTWRFR